MDVGLFDYDLPPDRIAQHPAEPRDAARLLDLSEAAVQDRRLRDLPALLRPGDVVVVNNTRVLSARLIGRRGQARIELLVHRERDEAGGAWRAFAKPAKRLRVGDTIRLAEASSDPARDIGDSKETGDGNRDLHGFSATVTAKGEQGEVDLRFDRQGPALARAFERYGAMPLPPYIRRDAPQAADREDYQTLFATQPGAVAAPTAGLHFTPALVAALIARGVSLVEGTLHVGPGTFLPVRVADTRDHPMHSEWGRLDAEAAARITDARRRGGRVVAVGTTSLRLLETAAAAIPDDEGASPSLPPHDPARKAQSTLEAWSGETDLFIVPGYRFRVVDLLLTNFHLPRSTLMMLVAAFTGRERILAAYRHAIAAEYRFYSYGDACLLSRQR